MKRILFVQHGDFRSEYLRFQNGGEEAYRDQKRSVDYVTNLTNENTVTVLRLGPETYFEAISPNLRTIGLAKVQLTAAQVRAAFDLVDPTHLILRSPHPLFLAEATRRQIWLLPSFADLFQSRGLRTIWQNRILRHHLTKANAPCVANHSLNASKSLCDHVGIEATRVVPWDWSRVPLGGAAKDRPADAAAPSLCFAGSLTASKGLGDLIKAVATLNQRGVRATATIAGPGDVSPWVVLVDKYGISNRINFVGRVSNVQVRQMMRESDFIVVPSRKDYPEGLPNVIYEGLASRSVLIISDHPAFAGRLMPDVECLVFRNGDADDLAAHIIRGCKVSLYSKISASSAAAHDSLYVGLEWTHLVDCFLSDPENASNWVQKNTLHALT